MITVKKYAEQKGVSHQAVYKQIQTHAAELEGHIVTKGRSRLLTDEAIEILEKHRETNPQIVERVNDKERIEELENQIKILLSRENELERKVAALSMELKDAYKKEADNAMLIASAETNRMLLEDKTVRLEQAELELRKFRKTFFNLYRKED